MIGKPKQKRVIPRIRNAHANAAFHNSWFNHKILYVTISGFALVVIGVVLYVVLYSNNKTTVSQPQVRQELEFDAPDLLVDDEKCKIPNVRPWNSQFKSFYEPKKQYSCGDTPLLTGIKYDGDQAYLYINQSILASISNETTYCCYQTVERETGSQADVKIKYSKCHKFKRPRLMNTAEVVVKCDELNTGRNIYKNAHSVIFKSSSIKEKIAAFEYRTKPPSILIIGIDSVSRLNFHRMLSKTKKHLDSMGWVEYKGYNKIDDNTFPNLMALLTGMNKTGLGEMYKPHLRGGLDRCPIIWKEYSTRGYVTTYIEDATEISTFNLLTPGFQDPPTDFYFRPYMIAAEGLGVKYVDGMSFCSGNVSSGERVLEVAKNFVGQLGDHPKFGLFWCNTFSHDDINAPARMDDILAEFFQGLQMYLNNTIVMFLSDHGMRFGKIRETKTGWYEDRLPFLYFWIPENFRIMFPTAYQYLIDNSNKLTTPYDVYMTLQDLLEIYHGKIRSKCRATENCKSLFEDVGSRSCQEVDIPMHYCTCLSYQSADNNSYVVQLAGKYAIQRLNAIVASDTITRLHCSQYQLKSIILAQKAAYWDANHVFLRVETDPEAIYEFTVTYYEYSSQPIFKMDNKISRIDKYDEKSLCVPTNKIFCTCLENT